MSDPKLTSLSIDYKSIETAFLDKINMSKAKLLYEVNLGLPKEDLLATPQEIAPFLWRSFRKGPPGERFPFAVGMMILIVIHPPVF